MSLRLSHRLLQALTLAGLVATSGQAFANPGEHVAPRGQTEKFRVKCATTEASYLYGYALEGVIDWSAGDNNGTGVFVLMRQNFPYEYGADYRRLKTFKIDVVFADNGIDQVIRNKDPKAANQVHITWRSELPRNVPALQAAIIDGVKYNFSICRSESKHPHRREMYQ